MPGKSVAIAAVICVAGLALSGCVTETGYYAGYYGPAYDGYGPAYDGYYGPAYGGYYDDGFYYGRNSWRQWSIPSRPAYTVPATPSRPAYIPGRRFPPLNPARPDDTRPGRPAPMIGQGAIVPATPASPASIPGLPIQRLNPARPDDARPARPAPMIGQGATLVPSKAKRCIDGSC
ncbi:hypothetical protein [Phyllobacterium leguminum]|uniref:PXPV repeat-containing protein n=1 Tax=Phyllobacterium leguminum TaxID=314237 RepID=A0A318TF36_9HYPH|nr:hypothetical protein [Phyllobacterium leguminum]PYE87064.1 hypothetical protein C7477_11622 [Phyllobacterium leguminum]